MHFAPAEVYPEELRGNRLIEPGLMKERGAPEARNEKILFIGFISCEITVIFPLSAVADRENKGNISNQKINNRLLQ